MVPQWYVLLMGLMGTGSMMLAIGKWGTFFGPLIYGLILYEDIYNTHKKRNKRR